MSSAASLFAVSQPFSPLSPDKREAVVNSVRERLLTPMGLRTLDPSDLGYKPQYKNSMVERDAAYHNGTVWPWLIGPYCEAVLRNAKFSPASKDEVRRALKPLIGELTTRHGMPGPIWQLAEVYDGEPVKGERNPDGCPAQAWSVAEVLRVLGLIDSTPA